MPFTINRPPTDDEELYWFVRLRFGVTIPRTKVCPDHVPPFRAFADAFFARNSFDPASPIQSLALWHGSRGLSGKSFMLSLLACTLAEVLGASVNLLGGSLAQSMNIHEHVNGALDYEQAPDFLVVERTNTRISFTNKAQIRPLTASQSTVRGPHPPRLLLDEIDEMDIKILDAALGQPLPQKNHLGLWIPPYTAMCSTWQNPQGTFTIVKRRAEERKIPIYTWCFLESANPRDGWLSQAAIDDKRASIPRAMWETEYELNEPSIGNRAFDTQSVDACFSLPHEPLHENPDDPSTKQVGGYLRHRIEKDFEEYVYEHPLRGADYAIAADWGKEKDYTVIGVARVDVKPYRLVYWLRCNRRPYPVMVGYFNKAMQRYHAAGIHDATGVGNMVDDYVLESARGFEFTTATKSAMLTEYVSDIEKKTIWRIPRIETAYVAHKWAQYGDLYGARSHAISTTTTVAQTYHLPDEVAMMGLLNHLVRHMPAIAGPAELTVKEPPQTKHQRQMDPPPKRGDTLQSPRRVGDVRRVEDQESAYSLG